jgi:hypothetical protein
MCPDRNVLNCFAHYNGFVVVTVLICIVIIYVVYNSSASVSDKSPAETEPSIQASNDHAHSEQAPSSAPPHGLSLFKLAALFSPVWAPPLLALLAPLLPGQGGAGLIVFTLFIFPLWGAGTLFSLRQTGSAFLVAIAYYAAAVVVTFFIGGIVLVLTGDGLY